MEPVHHVLWTGSRQCYDSDGQVISCQGTGQDAEFDLYAPWSEMRFEQIDDHLMQDRETQLIWLKLATLSEFPLTWQECLDLILEMNRQKKYGRTDWRLPNRRELRSLVDHARKNPALPANHPFDNVALGWYWTSTSAAVNLRYAWYIHLEGARMFYGRKDEQHWAWPVCGQSEILPRTGVSRCYDSNGKEVLQCNTGCDGDLRAGARWPESRFTEGKKGIIDRLTGLVWYPKATLGLQTLDWEEALLKVQSLSQQSGHPWRLPTINEMESLVDCSCHSPALPQNAPFKEIQEAYWTSTTSGYEADWAYVFYLHKGAVGVGFKKNQDFHVWPVMSPVEKPIKMRVKMP